VAGEPSFFSIGVRDAERGRSFYERLFGWQMQRERNGFSIATAGAPGGIHGGDPDASPYLFFRVDDIGTALDRVRALGGSVEEVDHDDDDAETVARFGRFKLCRDDQGSWFGLHEPPA
jgi:predicted enzyme related to lactoylglutathione lyase